MTQRTDVAQMYQWYKCGDSLEQVGQRVGLTRERIRQLFEKHKLPKLSLGERLVGPHPEYAANRGTRGDKTLHKLLV